MLTLFSGNLSRAQDNAVASPVPASNRAADALATAAVQAALPTSRNERARELDLLLSEQSRLINTRAPGGGRPVLIRSSDMDPTEEGNLVEDLTVMAHLFDKVLEGLPGEKRPYTAMGIDVFHVPGSRPMRSIYLEGYGAVFMLNVGFPLVRPPAKAEPKEAESETDSAWEEAKQELYGPRPGAGLPSGPAEEFSDQKVKELKAELLEALKSASNIRQMKDEDFVTVCVFGGASSGSARIGVKPATKPSPGPEVTSTPKRRWPASDQGGGQRGTIMTIRVKKADADAFAKGKMDFEQFCKQARVETYAGGAAGGGAAWIGGGGGFSSRNGPF